MTTAPNVAGENEVEFEVEKFEIPSINQVRDNGTDGVTPVATGPSQIFVGGQCLVTIEIGPQGCPTHSTRNHDCCWS